jgi:hypothetical protein
MFKKILFITVLIGAVGAGTWCRPQAITPENLEKLQIMEDSLAVTADSMYEAFIPDTHVGYSARFIKQLLHALKIPNSFQYPFSKLKDKINIIYADDTAFRIINWMIKTGEVSQKYYGAIQLPNENLKLFGLVDVSQDLGKGIADSVLRGGKWYGVLYYRIIGHEVDGKKIYTLFGFNNAGEMSNIKVLDPLTIDDNGPVFGAPIFGYASENFPKQRVNRFVLEYKKDVQASLNYDSSKQAIVFDYLTSMINDPYRKYTYVPSGVYDGFRWYNNMWNYAREIFKITILQDGEAPDSDEKK